MCRVLVPKRAGSLKISAKGIFKGAIVVRGPDWDWQDQDGNFLRAKIFIRLNNKIIFSINKGGEGKSGKVIEIRGWDRESGYSVACVQWNGTGCSNVYRVGHKGKVDLKYVQEGIGGFYYKDHLAVFGKSCFYFIVFQINCFNKFSLFKKAFLMSKLCQYLVLV